MKRFERSNGLDIVLYKNYLYHFFYAGHLLSIWKVLAVARWQHGNLSELSVANLSVRRERFLAEMTIENVAFV